MVSYFSPTLRHTVFCWLLSTALCRTGGPLLKASFKTSIHHRLCFLRHSDVPTFSRNTGPCFSRVPVRIDPGQDAVTPADGVLQRVVRVVDPETGSDSEVEADLEAGTNK